MVDPLRSWRQLPRPTVWDPGSEGASPQWWARLTVWKAGQSAAEWRQRPRGATWFVPGAAPIRKSDVV